MSAQPTPSDAEIQAVITNTKKNLQTVSEFVINDNKFWSNVTEKASEDTICARAVDTRFFHLLFSEYVGNHRIVCDGKDGREKGKYDIPDIQRRANEASQNLQKLLRHIKENPGHICKFDQRTVGNLFPEDEVKAMAECEQMREMANNVQDKQRLMPQAPLDTKEGQERVLSLYKKFATMLYVAVLLYQLFDAQREIDSKSNRLTSISTPKKATKAKAAAPEENIWAQEVDNKKVEEDLQKEMETLPKESDDAQKKVERLTSLFWIWWNYYNTLSFAYE
jgi:hypothetical protein